ncbi:MAG: Mov34/MPN/PAD-1 family protein [Terracidiphilus sp.]
MTQKSNSGGRQPSVRIDSEVARQIRQHAHSSSKSEICGVLIGQDRDGVIRVDASITGLNAQEAGAHVTFTQDTWEHIYKVKDKEFPGDRIVGWYHSHPGFGVFLSEHDSFIHKNFFSSPGQVAWVVDPHSDEEGCFGWVGGRIERLTQVAVVDRRGGERADESGRPEPVFSAADEEDEDNPYPSKFVDASGETSDSSSLQRLVGAIFSYLGTFLIGFLVAWYLFPQVELVPVPVDPQTGQPLLGLMEGSRGGSGAHNRDKDKDNDKGKADSLVGGGEVNQRPSQPGQAGNGAKGDHAQPK